MGEEGICCNCAAQLLNAHFNIESSCSFLGLNAQTIVAIRWQFGRPVLMQFRLPDFDPFRRLQIHFDIRSGDFNLIVCPARAPIKYVSLPFVVPFITVELVPRANCKRRTA